MTGTPDKNVAEDVHQAQTSQQTEDSRLKRLSGPQVNSMTSANVEALYHLSVDDAGSERLTKLNALLGSSETCSFGDLESIILLLEDMNVPVHDFDAKRVILKLLKSVAARSDLDSLRSRVLELTMQSEFDFSIRDQVATVYGVLKSREAQGTTETLLSPDLSYRIAQYVIEHLQGMFDSAETARKEQHDARKVRGVASEAKLGQRPDEEIALIRALKILQILIRLDRNILSARNEQIFSIATQLLKRTTGQTIMTAIMEVTETAFIHCAKPSVGFADCVQLICQISNRTNSRAQDLASHTLRCALSSPCGPEVMHVLVEKVLGDTSAEISLKVIALNALAEVYFCYQASQPRRDARAAEFASLCNNLQIRTISEQKTDLALPLLNVALAIYPDVDDDAFDDVIKTIQKFVAYEHAKKAVTLTADLVFAKGLIKLFLQCFHQHGNAAAKLYNLLVSIVSAVDVVAVKLDIIKFLARLRCNQNRGVRVVQNPDALELAAGLCRTRATVNSARDSVSPASRVSTNSYSSMSKKDGSQKSLKLARTRSRSRSSPQKFRDSFRVASQPLWMYGEDRKGLPAETSEAPSEALLVRPQGNTESQQGLIDPSTWLEFMIEILKDCHDWELYSYVLVHLPSQLSNSTLFQSCVKEVSSLHDLLSVQLGDGSFPDAPAGSNIRKGDIALCLYTALAMLLGYQNSIGVRQWNRVVSILRSGIEKWDRTGKFCIHSLAICCHEIPHIVSNHLNVIVEMMQKRITHFEIAADILEFLGGLSRLPEAWDRSDFLLHQKIFSICIRYLQHSREQRAGTHSVPNSPSPITNRASYSGIATQTVAQLGQGDLVHRKLHEYVFTTAYQVMIFWFLALDISERHRHVAWITQELSFKTEGGLEEMEPQSLVFLDMMHRTTFSDLGETKAGPQFVDSKQNVHRRTWLMGLSVITMKFLVNDATGRISHGQFTKRQASGTTHAIYFHNTEDMPAHQVHREEMSSPETKFDPYDMYPNHMILQLMSTISPLPAPLQPIPLPDDDEITDRIIRLFDKTDTVDGHKAAVIYIGDKQQKEQDIMANIRGSAAFNVFIEKLAYKVPLKSAKFNAQGLDKESGIDGVYTYAWRDRVTEIVFHVPTLMPTDLENDPACTRKKSHIGNDHVKIIFNESGLPFDRKTFASDFNSVNIVITPEAQIDPSNSKESSHGADSDAKADTGHETYYIVHTVISGTIPAISPTISPKLVSASSLPTLIRQLALNASVFCQVWSKDVGEYTSSWLFRLQQIMKLRERHAAANASSKVGYPQAADAGPSAHAEGHSWTGTVSHGGLAEEGKLVSSLDFTRWTK